VSGKYTEKIDRCEGKLALSSDDGSTVEAYVTGGPRVKSMRLLLFKKVRNQGQEVVIYSGYRVCLAWLELCRSMPVAVPACRTCLSVRTHCGKPTTGKGKSSARVSAEK
jgi:hypothetical protein